MFARTSIWRATMTVRPSSIMTATNCASSCSRSFCTQNGAREIRVPTLEDADSQALRFCELSNETLSIMAVNGVHKAHKERLLREIMRVDRVTWEDAGNRLAEINTENDKHMIIVSLPYRIGIWSAIVTGIGSIPMVFHAGTAKWFNETFVHQDVPPPEDLETIYQVGQWTWGWMEPVLGTASFVLLAMQLMRAQMRKMQLKPYTEYILSKRADHLALQFPMYRRDFVRDFAKSDPWHS